MKHHIKKTLKHKGVYIFVSSFWFLFGFIFAGLFLFCLVVLYFKQTYKERIYPGIYIENVYVGEKTKDEVIGLFEEKNSVIQSHYFEFALDDNLASISAQDLNIGYNSDLLSEQAYSIGRSAGIIPNLYLILSSYLNGTYLVASYSHDQNKIDEVISPIAEKIYRPPTDALFKVENDRVIAFRESSSGKSIDRQKLDQKIADRILQIIRNKLKEDRVAIEIPIKTTEPSKSTEQANDLGIVEIIGEGKSYFAHSIPNRVHNITLAASRINGILIAPGELFSFNMAIGDISKFTGYKEAFVIKNGKTVLGDGGGVCQVSTTLFRSVLNTGLPILERHAHAYRVGYYEQNFPPGIDATIYSPSIDLKFKNDTENHILIQSYLDPENSMLVFTIYGRKDGREVEVSTPVITSQTPPSEPLYQDDPNLPVGTTRQVEYAAYGASVSFERVVKKDGKILYQDKFKSRYIPWQAVFLRGTKQG